MYKRQELYISDHPLDCLTCATNGDCELQDMAGAVGLREVRYGYEGENHLSAIKDESNPYFTFDPSKCIVSVSYTHLDVYKRQVLGLARKMGIKSTLSSCPKHKYNSPLHVILTRLQLSQKLCEWGEMKPILV